MWYTFLLQISLLLPPYSSHVNFQTCWTIKGNIKFRNNHIYYIPKICVNFLILSWMKIKIGWLVKECFPLQENIIACKLCYSCKESQWWMCCNGLWRSLSYELFGITTKEDTHWLQAWQERRHHTCKIQTETTRISQSDKSTIGNIEATKACSP